MFDREPAMRVAAMLVAAMGAANVSACTGTKEEAPMVDEPEDTAARAAMLMSSVMNLAPVFHDAATLQAIDPDELRATLLATADELEWFGSVAPDMGGLTWPSDAQGRIDRLRAATTAWAPAVAPPREVLDAARDCFGMIHPIAPTP